MRIRTGIGPDDWREEGPAFARVQGFGGSMVEPIPVPRKVKGVRQQPITEARREQLRLANLRYAEKHR